MKELGTYAEIEEAVTRCKHACAAQGTPFHVDALAAALGVSYDTLCTYAAGKGKLAQTLRAVIQDCTASVIGAALAADPKSHSLWMFYLRNRASFLDKGDKRDMPNDAPVVFVGEEQL